MSDFKRLIKKYAGDKQICNCGNAYLSNVGEGFVNGRPAHNIPICEYGCSAAQITAKEYIASCDLEEIERLRKEVNRLQALCWREMTNSHIKERVRG